MSYRDPFMSVDYKKMPLGAKHSWYRFIATCGYVGHAPFASGTFGSLLAYPIYIFGLQNYVSEDASVLFLYVITFIASFLGWISISLLHKETEAYDNSAIVIDELAGQLLTLAISQHWLFYLGQKTILLHHLSLSDFSFIMALVLFRIYDITKPLFIKTIDRFHKYATAVIADDLAAAALASASIYILYYITLHFY